MRELVAALLEDGKAGRPASGESGVAEAAPATDRGPAVLVGAVERQEVWSFPDIDPIAFQIGPLAVRWYGLMYLFGFVGGYFVVGGWPAEEASRSATSN